MMADWAKGVDNTSLFLVEHTYAAAELPRYLVRYEPEQWVCIYSLSSGRYCLIKFLNLDHNKIKTQKKKGKKKKKNNNILVVYSINQKPRKMFIAQKIKIQNSKSKNQKKKGDSTPQNDNHVKMISYPSC